MINDYEVSGLQKRLAGKRVKRQRKAVHMSKVLAKVCAKAWKEAEKAIIAAIPAILIGNLAIKSAYEQRGYEAIGGEWILIGIVFVMGYWIQGRKA